MRYVVQPAPDFKPMNVGLRKRLSFSAQKQSLDMLACVSNMARNSERACAIDAET